MSVSDMAADKVPTATCAETTVPWQRFVVVVFACINVASLGVFFAVFVGVVLVPPNPRNLVFLLAVGSFALAVLVMGQFVSWSRVALRAYRGRR